VRDDDCGIREQDLPRIFEPFHTTKSETDGTGLGLWIVEGSARDHGGWVEPPGR
jgi:signal transduction histidine kinase